MGLPPRVSEPASFASRSLHRNGLALVASSGLSSLLGVAYWAIAARTTGPASVGENSALLAAMLTVSTLGQMGLGSSLVTYLPRSGNPTRLVRNTYLVAVGTSLVLALLLLAASVSVRTPLVGLRTPALAVFFVVAVAGWTIFTLQDNVLTGLRRAIWVPFENVAYSLIKIALLLVWARSMGGYGIFVAWVIPALILIPPISGAAFLRFIPNRALVAEAKAGTEMPFVRYAAGDTIGSFLGLISTTFIPVLVTWKLGATANGFFYVPWTLAQSLDLLSVNFGMSLIAEGARQANQARLLGGLLAGRMLLVVLLLVVVGMVAAPWVMAVFGSGYSANATPVLRVLLLGSLVRSYNTFGLSLARAELKPMRIVAMQSTVATIVLGGSFIGMGTIGIMGPAVAWLAGQVGVALVANLVSTAPRLRLG
jgi:O-antigen/teichoic acid export membrane protein